MKARTKRARTEKKLIETLAVPLRDASYLPWLIGHDEVDGITADKLLKELVDAEYEYLRDKAVEDDPHNRMLAAASVGYRLGLAMAREMGGKLLTMSAPTERDEQEA